MIIHQMEYEIFIDKKTFNTTAFTMIMDMEMGPKDGTMRIKQNIKADISKINELKEIKVPQEVLDAAVRAIIRKIHGEIEPRGFFCLIYTGFGFAYTSFSFESG